MAKRAIIRRGDRTTHGGTVLTGDPTFILAGREVARVGDSVSCPQCKRASKIITGAPTMFSGQLVARHDDVTDCGARLIASQATDTCEDGSEGAGTSATLSNMPPARVAADGADDIAASAAMTSASDDDTPRSVRFQAVDPTTGQPLPKRPYVLTCEDGSQHGGLTDAEGYTKTIDASAPEHVAVHFMFADPDGQTIDREELLP